LTPNPILNLFYLKVITMKKLLILISLSLLALSGNAFADPDNYTAANGTGCSAYFASDTASFDHQFDGIRNNSAASRWVSCPVDKDNIGSVGGLGTTWVRWAGAGTMSCVLNNFNINGVRTQARTTSGTPGWISFAALGLDDFWGTNTMYCLVPAGATLQTYHYFEI
jgi:hypothetical protein